MFSLPEPIGSSKKSPSVLRGLGKVTVLCLIFRESYNTDPKVGANADITCSFRSPRRAHLRVGITDLPSPSVMLHMF